MTNAGITSRRRTDEALAGATRSSRWHRYEWLIPAAGCLILMAQLFLSVRQLSVTCDEPTHLYAGYRYWKCGDFGFGAEHPPLARLIAAAPLVPMHIAVDCRIPQQDEARAALDWLYANDVSRLVARARAAVSVCALGLCLLVWFAARRMFGFTTALVAVLLLIFEPNTLAVGALVTTDMALTFTFPLAIYAFYLWIKRRTWPCLLLAGAATGLTLVAKMSGAVVLPLLVLLAITEALMQSAGWQAKSKSAMRNLAALGIIGVLAWGVIWSVYGFRFAARPQGVHLYQSYPGAGLFAQGMMMVQKNHLLPEAFAEGMLTIHELSSAPRQMFLLGRLHAGEAWYFFPVNILIKYTLALLVLLGVSVAGVKSLWPRYRRELLFLLLPGLGFLAVTVALNRMVSSIRHVMPVTFFVVVFAAAGAVEMARRARWAKLLLACALLAQASSSLHAYPYYLSYAGDLWGGPANAYRWLSNNDEGEAFLAVKKYVEQHPGEPCWLAHIYQLDVAPYGVPCRQFWGGHTEAIPPHVHGLIILDSLYIENAQENWAAPIIRLHQPVARIAGSAMLAYEGDFDTHSASGASQALIASRALSHGQFEEALQHARAGVAAAPELAWVRWEYCRALVGTENAEEARIQCRVARALWQEDKALSHYDAKYGYEVADPQAGTGIEEAVIAGQLNLRREFAAALPHARRAVALAGNSGLAHFAYCQTLLGEHDFQTSGPECQTARVLQMSGRYAQSGFWEPAPGGIGLVDLWLPAIDEEAPRLRISALP